MRLVPPDGNIIGRGNDPHLNPMATSMTEQGRAFEKTCRSPVVKSIFSHTSRGGRCPGVMSSSARNQAAGPTGYPVYWQLTALGVTCEVVAPSLVPVEPGGRVKTDRRDALKLARSCRAGDSTAVWVPDAAHDALRDLVRAPEAAKTDQLRHERDRITAA